MKWLGPGLLLIAFCSALLLHAQTKPDSLRIFESRSGMKFARGNKTLTMPELMSTLQVYQPAYDEMKRAKRNKGGLVLDFVGGFLIGWPLGDLIAGEKPQWIMAGIGAGVIGISIPFDKSFKKHAKRSVELFNNHLQ